MKKSLTAMIIAATLFLGLYGCSKNDDVPSNPNVKTFVIVPGAWSAPYAWVSVKAKLEAAGNRVFVVQLLGHGADTKTPFNTIHLDSYRDQVVHLIDSLNTKVILCGHSMGGMVITEVAEKIPARIEKLVYVNAFLPTNRHSLLDLANTDANSLLGMSIRSTDNITLDLVRDRILDIFIQDGSTDVKNLVLANYRTEPGYPFADSVTISAANYGSVNKYYIHTIQDHAITYDLQKRMVAAAGVKNVYQLNTSHSPFLAKPDSLAIILQKIAN